MAYLTANYDCVYKKKVLNENDNIKWTSARYFCKQKCKKKKHLKN